LFTFYFVVELKGSAFNILSLLQVLASLAMVAGGSLVEEEEEEQQEADSTLALTPTNGQTSRYVNFC